MYMGRIVERAPVERIFHNPCHPYTKALLRSVPVLGHGKAERLETIRGSTPSTSECTKGCEFANRCDFMMDKCRVLDVPVYEIEENHHVRCLLFQDSKELQQ